MTPEQPMKNKIYRHGEIGFLEIDKLPEGLTESKTSTFATGSHGNDHTFKGGKLYLLEKMEGQTIGYLEAKNTSLYHPEHSPNGEAKLPDGVYELKKQVEFTPEGLVPIID